MNRLVSSVAVAFVAPAILWLVSINAAPQRTPDVRKRLKDPSPSVRKRAALALAEANDAEAIPVLIDLLDELSTKERQPVEDALKQLAGEWALSLQISSEDRISRGVRRDAWASWWRRTDGAALLAVVAQHTLTADKRRKVQELVTQLGSDDFSVRENASRLLPSFGRLALPCLREALKDRDAERARRAKLLIERLEHGPDTKLPVAALRLLAVRKPAGAVEALLAYLPYADDDIREEEIRKSLTVLARRDGKLDAALRRGLANAQPKVRAVAAEALIEGGGAEERAAVRKMLREDVPSVRLRVALAMARSGEREGVAVLIDLLPLLSANETGQAEDALYQLAGDTAPKMPVTETTNAKKRRDVWSIWWKRNASQVDLARLRSLSSLGYTLICDNFNNRVFEIDRHGNQLWGIDDVGHPLDAVVLPGKRVLIAETRADRITERDFKGKILWQKRIASPVNVQRLPNGHTFIVTSKNETIVEVDRAGREIYRLHALPGGVMAACRSHRGDIVCLTKDGQCRFFDTTGKQLKKFASGHDGNSIGGIDSRPNGHILIARNEAGKVVEFDGDGKIVLELAAPGCVTASRLPNGNILTAMHNPRCIYEMDLSGKIVWQYKGAGNNYRARRR